MYIKISIVLTLLLCSSPVCADGAFGIEIGQSLSELDVEAEGSNPTLSSVPNPHPDFRTYSVMATENTGVCVIIGISKLYENDRYGVTIRNDFDKFTEALSQKYGVAELIDQRKVGGIYDEADDWVMSIRQNELVFAATWDSPNDAPDLDYLELRIFAIKSHTTVMKIMYKGSNFFDCEAEIEEENNSSF